MYGSSPLSRLAARAASDAARIASAARYTPAGQPSVRCTNAPTVSSEQSRPAWARTARVSSSLNARSSTPNSTERPSLRRRPKPSVSRDPTARWNPAGRPAANARMKFIAATLPNSWTSSSTSTPCRFQVRKDVRRWASAARCRDPSPTARALNTAGSSGSMRCSAKATCHARRTGSPSASSTVTQANSRESSAAHWLSTVVLPYPAGAVSKISEAWSGVAARTSSSLVRATSPSRCTGRWIFASTAAKGSSEGPLPTMPPVLRSSGSPKHCRFLSSGSTLPPRPNRRLSSGSGGQAHDTDIRPSARSGDEGKRMRRWPGGDQGCTGTAPSLSFLRVPEPKSSKNRLHVDVKVSGGRDKPAELRRRRIQDVVDRLVAAGAAVERLDEQAGVLDHVIMTDPEGNEFCVV